MKRLSPFSRVGILISALALVSAYYVPLWQILMWAPQYPEGLEMKIWIDNITGDVKIISALNHYIGMRHIEVSMFPEFGYMIYLVGAVIGLGVLTAIMNRRALLVGYATVLIACGIAALVDFYLWGYDYGHNLDPTAAIVVPGMSYQPPLIGTKQLLNFTAFSGPDIGGWIFMVSAVITLALLGYEIYKSRQGRIKTNTLGVIIVGSLITLSCTTNPEPIDYGKDGCYHCKMTLMDNRFGAELISRKGRVFKFDDISCMMAYVRLGQLREEDVAHWLVTDFAVPGKLIDASKAYYIHSEDIRSPMAGNIAGFASIESLKEFNGQWNGRELSWAQLNGRME